MKVFHFLFLILFSSWSFGQMDFEVRLSDGPTVYGFTSVKLLREGLVCRKIISEDDKWKEISFFVPFPALDSKKYQAIQDYIATNKLFEIKEAIPETASTNERDHPTRIALIQLEKDEYSSFLYSYCKPEVDTLIKMMNALIPKEQRDIYRIRIRCI